MKDCGFQPIETIYGAGYSRRLKNSGSEEGEEHSFSFLPEVDSGKRGEDEEGQHLSRVVVVDSAEKVLFDNFMSIKQGEPAGALDGQSASIIDKTAGKRIGAIYINVDQEFLATEYHGFLSGTLYTTLIGGVVTAIAALIIALWLSRRILKPITFLTEAAHKISGGDLMLIPTETSVDELGEMSTAFNRMSDALSTQKLLRKRLIDDLTHELDNPLSIIKLEAKGLSDGFQTSEKAAELIIQEVGKLKNLVQDLNWLAESDTGELQFKFSSHTFKKILVEETERWKSEAELKSISLVLEASINEREIQMDSMRLSQAVGNILRNAITHTPVGGKYQSSPKNAMELSKSQSQMTVLG